MQRSTLLDGKPLGCPLRFVSLRDEDGTRVGLLLARNAAAPGTELLSFPDLAQSQAIGTRYAYGAAAGVRAFEIQRLELMCAGYRLLSDDIPLRGGWLYELLKTAGLSFDLYLTSAAEALRQRRLGPKRFAAWLADPRVVARRRLPSRTGLLSADSDGFCRALLPAGDIAPQTASRLAGWRNLLSPVSFVALLRLEDPLEVVELLSYEGCDLRDSSLSTRELLRDQLLAELTSEAGGAECLPLAVTQQADVWRQNLLHRPALWSQLRLHHPARAGAYVLRADS